MKLALLKQKVQLCFIHSGLLILVVNLFLASTSPVQAVDTRIAFMSTRSGNGEIYLMNPDGKRIRRLTKHLEYDSAPAWSPDGQKIAFSSFRDQHRFKGRGPILAEIYVMNPDGTNPINLTQAPERADLFSSWSPDGKQIAFGSIIMKGPIWDIWVMGADGEDQRNLTNHGAKDRRPDWSPDRMRIAFESNREGGWEFDFWGNMDVYVMNADGTNPINLTNHPALDGYPDWSPDGMQIAFESNRDGDDNWEIYVMNADGTNPINLTNHPAEDRHPAWSPDGKRIAFESNRDGNWERNRNDNWEVFVMNPDGANPINLTNDNRAWDGRPTWEPVPNLSVSPKRRLATLWGKVKRTNTYGIR